MVYGWSLVLGPPPTEFPPFCFPFSTFEYMSLRLKSTRGSLVLTIGEAAVAVSSFVRNMILARLLTKADFGIAATFALIIALLEFSSKMGIGRFLVREPEGEKPDFMASAHAVQFGMGLFSAVVMALAAWPLARLFEIPDQAWAVQVLAMLPLVNGLQHLDIRRFERSLRYGPSAFVEAVPQVLITLAAWPVARWLGDFRAVLALLLAKALFSCVASQLVAERRYRWGMQRDYVVRMLRFGWPLVLNSFLMFGVLYGEQFLVAAFYVMSELAPYAAAVTLTVTPSYFFGRVFAPVALPLLARVQADAMAFQRRYRQVVCMMAWFAGTCAVGLIVGGEALMRVVYGQKYVGYGIILACLAAVSALRNVRLATSHAALAKGDSQNEMWSNGARLIGLLPALALAWFRQPVWLVACTGLLGESAACGVAIIRLRRRDGVPLAASLVPLGWVAALVLGAAAIAGAGAQGWPTLWGLLAAGTLATAGGGLMILVLPELRREAVLLWQSARTTGWRGLPALLREAGATGKPATT